MYLSFIIVLIARIAIRIQSQSYGAIRKRTRSADCFIICNNKKPFGYMREYIMIHLHFRHAAWMMLLRYISERRKQILPQPLLVSDSDK